ncbi:MULTISPECIES: carboxypeptidase regulatory-like domain-containing protein [Sphingobacterium]|uniref:TonB-dependent receptor n=1 Tax=Sphingobacterium TaxID=28453 RepID=UPI0013DC98E1|nr:MULTISPECIES: carboxypeptidase regulatory-like domain-containing protein [unclassified Sphingobacterium]
MKKSLLFFALVLASYGTIQAQVTTSSMTGVVTEAAGQATVGATIKATHLPSGTAYSGSANSTGRFNLANMRVGGPYRVEVTYVGQNPIVYEDVYLQLGQAFVLNPIFGDEAKALEEVTVTGVKGSRTLKTGASTVIGKKQLEEMPTLSRSLQDFTRLTPQANGNSFGGANNRFNNITIDGAVNNDVFGLASSGTPGGQASTQPISLDAIQEIQVVLAPYDVTFGNFTGGGVNAVTRSGTNQVEGSAYVFFRNQNTIGKNVLTNKKSDKFSDNQYGFRVGGPIVKDKLFFFLNGEMGRRSSPLSYNAGEPGAAIDLATAEAIAKYTLDKYGYDVGAVGPQDVNTQNNKIFTKLDWNINEKHSLAVRYNYIDAFDDNISRTGTFFRFGNNAYKFSNKQHVAVAELRSNFNNRFSNNLIIGYSSIKDSRDIAGGLFPQITIGNIGGVSSNSVEFGSQRSSVANELDQTIFEFTNNFKWYVGKHTFTFGTHNEFFNFRNLFINNLNGRWDFNSVQDYLDNKPNRVRATYSLIPGNDRPSAEFNAAQLGFYVQGESEVIDNLKLTYGLRIDVPVISDKPLRNEKIEASFPGYRTDNTPSGKLLWAPRLGFNYDVQGDRSIIVRGGAGIFTGRVPFVWLSNQFSNSGMLFGTVDARTTGINGGNGFDPNIENQKNMGAGSTRAEVNLVNEDFKIPQVARFNLAGDFRLPYGIEATLEGIYSKTLNNIVYSDINISGSKAAIDPALTGGADTRPSYAGQRVNSGAFTNVILMDNTNKGYTYSLTAQLKKRFNNGINAMVAYTNGGAKSVNDGASSTALSNWEYVQIVNNPNDPALTVSNYNLKHRVIGSLGYGVSYGKNKLYSTSVNLFYAGTSGSPFTYLYNGDLNGDGAFSNDLLYVPNTMGEIKLIDLKDRSGKVIATPQQQWEALNAYIEGDDYLKSKRGQYVERNGSSLPWQHQFDLRITQDLGVLVSGSKNRLQLTFDIFNVGNLLNKDWGRSYFVGNQALTLVSYNNNNGGYTFSAPKDNLPYNVSDLSSRWQGQFGIRYIFN